MSAFKIRMQGELVTMSAEEARQRGTELYREIKEAEQSVLRRRVRLGVFLLQVSQQVEHGTWGHWLDVAGIHRKTAQRSIKLAGQLAGVNGELDGERLRAALIAWNAAHPGNQVPLPVEARTELENFATHGSFSGPTLRQVELATGIRKPEPGLLGREADGTPIVPDGSEAPDPTPEELALADEYEEGHDEENDDLSADVCRVEQRPARGAHNAEVGGSTPPSAIHPPADNPLFKCGGASRDATSPTAGGPAAADGARLEDRRSAAGAAAPAPGIGRQLTLVELVADKIAEVQSLLRSVPGADALIAALHNVAEQWQRLMGRPRKGVS